MKTGIIYSVGLYQRGVVNGDSRGQEEGTNVESTKTIWGEASPSYNPLGIVIFLV